MSTFTVINTNDTGSGSLRQAVIDANLNPGSTIDILVSGTINLTTGQLTITTSTIIRNMSGGTVIVSGSNISNIFNIATAGIAVNISDITISDGQNNFGAGINLNAASTLTVNNCIFSNNNAVGGVGGAISSRNGSTLIVNDCIFNTNTGVTGGSIYVNSSSATINNSTFRNATTTSQGGAINISGTTPNVSINSCIIQNNTANLGGAIYHSSGNLSINNTTINGNFASSTGGGINSISTDQLQIFNTTISNNSATVLGGGLFMSLAGTRTIINCTFNGNSSPNCGGVYNSTGTTTLIGCTISNNTDTSSGAGGGIKITGGIVSIGNTVIAVNPINATPDFLITGGTIISLGNNFIGNATGTGAVFTQSGDQTGTTISPINPLLLPLGNYGGLTETMIPQSTPPSPLINAGSSTIVATYYIFPQLLNSGTPIDQRGFFRIINGTVDIGSVETGPVICFSGESEVLTRNYQTDKIEIIRAENVVAHVHEVYDVIENKFITVKHNVVNGPVIRFIKISKDSIGPNQPNKDFYVTGGHSILINDRIMKARDVPHAKKVKVKSQKVFSICTEKQTAIMINGLGVMTWSEKKFIEYAKKHNIIWNNNRITVDKNI